MKSYGTYYHLLGRTADSTPNLELLRCQHLLLSRLRRLLLLAELDLETLTVKERKSFSKHELDYLTSLHTAIHLLEIPSTKSQWDNESIITLRECNQFLLDCIGISIRRFEKSLHVTKTPKLPEQDEAADEKIWGPIIESYIAIKMERVTEQDIVIAAPMLARAVNLEWSPRIHVAY